MRRISYIACLLTFVIAGCSDDFMENRNEIHQSPNNKTVSEIAQTLEKSFASKVTRSYTKEINYPDYYGGVFLNRRDNL